MKLTILVIIVFALLQGCAANMAAQGQNGPDINVVKRQQTRDDVERMLGLPFDTIRRTDGEIVELYIVEARTEPDAARAAGHATADLFTLGLWEFVGGPVEAYQARRQRVVVHYDENDHVVSVMADRQIGNAGDTYR